MDNPVAALQSKANLNTVGIVLHNKDGEVGAVADLQAKANIKKG